MNSADIKFPEGFSEAARSGDYGKAYSAVSGCDSSDAAALYLRGLMRCAGQECPRTGAPG